MDYHCDWNQGAVVSSCACAADRKGSGVSVAMSEASASSVADPSEWCFDDRAKSDKYTCEQHLKWGDCEKPWLRRGNFCRKTCFGCDCTDERPKGSSISCVVSAAIGRCRTNWMKDNRYCERSCGYCGLASVK